MKNLILFGLSIFFFHAAFADVTPECIDASKAPKEDCSKDSFDEAFSEAFSQVPFNFKVIYKNFDKCTKSIANCYALCGNTTLKKGSSGPAVLNTLKSSYGKKPHTAQIVNCRGRLSSYAKNVEATCKGEYILEKSQMDSKDQAMSQLAQRCTDFFDFKTPEAEEDFAELVPFPTQQGVNTQTASLGDLPKPRSSEVTTNVRVGIQASSQNLETQPISNSNLQSSVNALSQAALNPRPVVPNPGGERQQVQNTNGNIAQAVPPVNLGVANLNQQKSLQKNKKNKKKRRRRSSPLKKISDQLATDQYYKPDPVVTNSLKLNKVKTAGIQSQNLSNGVQVSEVSNRGTVAVPQNTAIEVTTSIFDRHKQAVETLRENRQTLE